MEFRLPPIKLLKKPTDLEVAIAKLGYPSILKTSEGGYDGHGQQDINSEADLLAGQRLVAQAPCILEQRQNFTKELSVHGNTQPRRNHSMFSSS